MLGYHIPYIYHIKWILGYSSGGQLYEKNKEFAVAGNQKYHIDHVYMEYTTLCRSRRSWR